jgi:hypothetical protein
MTALSSLGMAIPDLLFFQEAMQHEHDFLVPHRVDGAVGTTFVVLGHFQNTSAAEALERLGCIVLVAVLSEVQCMPEESAHDYR